MTGPSARCLRSCDASSRPDQKRPRRTGPPVMLALELRPPRPLSDSRRAGTEGRGEGGEREGGREGRERETRELRYARGRARARTSSFFTRILPLPIPCPSIHHRVLEPLSIKPNHPASGCPSSRPSRRVEAKIRIPHTHTIQHHLAPAIQHAPPSSACNDRFTSISSV